MFGYYKKYVQRRIDSINDPIEKERERSFLMKAIPLIGVFFVVVLLLINYLAFFYDGDAFDQMKHPFEHALKGEVIDVSMYQAFINLRIDSIDDIVRITFYSGDNIESFLEKSDSVYMPDSRTLTVYLDDEVKTWQLKKDIYLIRDD